MVINGMQKEKAETFNILRDYIESYIYDIEDYVFRGQANSNWKLASTLNRLIVRARETGTKTTDIDSFIKQHLDRFRLEIRGRRGDTPSHLDEDGLWALGQHYGLATPLLDWSSSPYISLFFALTQVDVVMEDRVLWGLNKRKVSEKNTELSGKEQLKLIFPDTDDNKNC